MLICSLLIILLVLVFFRLPHGKVAVVGKSGLHAKPRQDPAVKHVPDGDNAEDAEEFHRYLLHIIFNIYNFIFRGQVFSYPQWSTAPPKRGREMAASGNSFAGSTGCQLIEHSDNPGSIPTILFGSRFLNRRGDVAAQVDHAFRTLMRSISRGQNSRTGQRTWCSAWLATEPKRTSRISPSPRRPRTRSSNPSSLAI
jgi:hypothetical protein